MRAGFGSRAFACAAFKVMTVEPFMASYAPAKPLGRQRLDAYVGGAHPGEGSA
jgi:hypothetical protein